MRVTINIGIILLISLLFSSVTYAQQPFKLWSKYKPLTWEDFKAPIDFTDSSHAMAYTGTFYVYRMVPKNGKRTFEFEVTSRFEPGKSWSKPSKQTPELLQYQQAYFNITEFFTRKLKQEYNTYQFTNNFKEEIIWLCNRNANQRKAMQWRFYLATAFAEDKSITQRWINFVDELLANNYTIAQAIKKEPEADFQNTSYRKLWLVTSPLQWSDFKGPIDSTSKYAAAINSGAVFMAQVKEDEGKYRLNFKVAAMANYDQSWAKPALQTADLLRHEQMHFNIAEFVARQLYKQLNNYNYTANYVKEVAAIRNQNIAQLKALQERYDEQTDHNKNRNMQILWETYITNLLNSNFTFEEAWKKMPQI